MTNGMTVEFGGFVGVWLSIQNIYFVYSKVDNTVYLILVQTF